MAITITPRLQSGAEGKALPNVRTWLDVTGFTGDSTRVLVQDAPKKSKYYSESQEVPLEISSDFPGRDGLPTNEFLPDISGKYTLVVLDLDSAPERKPSYIGSPNAEHQESIISRTLVELYVSALMSIQIGSGVDTSKLIFYVNDTDVHSTSSALYGVEIGDTPRFDSSSSYIAEQVAQSLDAAGFCSDLADKSAGAILGSLPSLALNWAECLNQHFNDNSIHDLKDGYATDVLEKGETFASSPGGFVEVLNVINESLVMHMRNSIQDSHAETDLVNLPILGGAGDSTSALLLMGDLYRVIEAHFLQEVQPYSHSDKDYQIIDEPGELILLIAQYFRELANMSPTGSGKANPGALQLIASGGLTNESD